MKQRTIGLLPGDGIGPEIMHEAIKVLDSVMQFSHDFRFNYKFGTIGAQAIESTGNPLPESTIEICNTVDAILLGAVGSPIFDANPDLKVRPEQGLLKLRKELGLFANLRPIKFYSNLAGLSPLKENIIAETDILIFRELTGGIYFGEKKLSENGRVASDMCVYSAEEIIRITKLAFEAAMKRSKRVTLVDKANVLESSRLWRRTVTKVAQNYPEVNLEFMYVDNAAMKLIQKPSDFDIILTENMFGDILSDEASVISGSLGLLPSASIGDRIALYEPVHGSYPQAAGKNIANPIGMILSVAMMLEHSFGMHTEAELIIAAVEKSIADGIVTCDLHNSKFYSTTEVGDYISGMVKEAFLLHEV